MINYLKYYYKRVYHKWHYDTFKTLVNQGRMMAERNSIKKNILSLGDVEFQVFSQRGEDGIIQYLVSHVDIANKIFIEFGVEDYTESNTRFMLINNNWSGLVIDSSELNVRFIQKDFIYWKYDIRAYQSFITRENINGLINQYTAIRDIGLLSIDVDGNDYWVWEAIDTIRPGIVVCEYNSIFGNEKKLTIPYDPSFVKTKAHFSNLYFGASLGALVHLADKKGYDFIGTTTAGVNAFFVRSDIDHPFKRITVAEGYHESANRDSRNANGRLSYLSHDQRLHIIKEMPLVDIESGKINRIKDIFGLD